MSMTRTVKMSERRHRETVMIYTGYPPTPEEVCAGCFQTRCICPPVDQDYADWLAWWDEQIALGLIDVPEPAPTIITAWRQR